VPLRTAKSGQPGDVRIVDVTSTGHACAPKAGIDFEDLNQEKGGPWTRYRISKLRNILHAKEVNRQFGPDSERKGEGEI
jgi:hypothetical protein